MFIVCNVRRRNDTSLVSVYYLVGRQPLLNKTLPYRAPRTEIVARVCVDSWMFIRETREVLIPQGS